mmetsp:Transcript_5087/g.7374  ORF Transcript_5087/g.7374 Transcript_5087/m.7374 type:complete len:236 (-) Transcript_5087:177-884(-)
MIKSYTEKSLLAIEGESSSSVKDFQSSTRALIWSPQMLKGQGTTGGKEVLALKLLRSMIETLQDKKEALAFDKDEEESTDDQTIVETGDDQFSSWATHMQYLWIIGKGWTQPVKPIDVADPPPKFSEVVVDARKSVIDASGLNRPQELEKEDEKKEDDGYGDKGDKEGHRSTSRGQGRKRSHSPHDKKGNSSRDRRRRSRSGSSSSRSDRQDRGRMSHRRERRRRSGSPSGSSSC